MQFVNKVMLVCRVMYDLCLLSFDLLTIGGQLSSGCFCAIKEFGVSKDLSRLNAWAWARILLARPCLSPFQLDPIPSRRSCVSKYVPGGSDLWLNYERSERGMLQVGNVAQSQDLFVALVYHASFPQTVPECYGLLI